MSYIEKWLELRNEIENFGVELLVVTKNCEKTLINELYKLGQINFGENRVQELYEKSRELDSTIKWHFIGHLQSNKCGKLLEVPNLYMIQSLDSLELCNLLILKTEKLNREINVLIQVNTTLKQTQYVTRILESQRLKFCGLMTIGDGGIECFQRLNMIKNVLMEQFIQCRGLGNEFIMSMGMSNDYKLAIQMGSNHIRIGSLIFN
uniref:Proline synthetase associated protein, putative n=1 Tax=Theileria annulata TaxID=5874 RepID=A0A3B0MMA1_THEAN